jgi:tetratricopeptide (TPR) repeat protein
MPHEWSCRILGSPLTGVPVVLCLLMSAALAQPPDTPFLRIEAGMHTAPIIRIDVDVQARFLVTSSHDKTARVWSLASGELLKVLRPPVRVFYSYAHEDEALRDELEKHLSLMQRQGIIQAWHDREITAGRAWKDAFDQHLEAAELILLLISPDFLHSDYCYDIEMRHALARHDAGEAWVLPIHLRPVDWQEAPFARLQALPTDARPVTEWADSDQAFRNIAQGIRQAAQAIRHTAAHVPIANTILIVPEGGHHRRRRKVFPLLIAVALLAAAGLGWYGYTLHAAPIARALAAGNRFLATGQYEHAKEAYQQALTQTWFDTRAVQLGLEKASVFDAADGEFHPIVIEQRINRILEQSPDDPHAYLFRGDLHATIDAYEDAEKFYTQAIARDPTLAHGYFRLGVIHDKLGQRDQAVEMYEQAVKHAPWHQTYLNNLAYEYSQQHHYDKAIATYRRALALNADFLITYFDLSHVYRAVGDLERELYYQQKGVSRIDDPQIAASKINQESWYFRVDEELIRLDTLPQKRCYAYRSVAATLRALQRRVDAEDYQRKSCGLDSIDEGVIHAWVDLETRHTGQAQRSSRP